MKRSIDELRQLQSLPLEVKVEKTKLHDMKLVTTGCKRTGCMFCMFGCSNKSWDNFMRMKQTHPKQYDYIMKPWDEGGLDYKNVIDWLNENGNLKIRY